MDAPPVDAQEVFDVRALLLGERIDVRRIDFAGRLAPAPLSVSVESGGIAVLFRYGAVVLFDVSSAEANVFLDRLQPLVSGAYDDVETEQIQVRIASENQEGVDNGAVCLRDRGLERLQIVADVLAKSVVVARYESNVARDFDRIEPFALDLERQSRTGRQAKELLRHIGGALLQEHRMVGRVEVVDKPDLVWERPELERLFLRLEDEFEIRERHRALERKLQLISRTAQTALDVLQNRRALRVDWYIVLLIALEILLTLYERFL